MARIYPNNRLVERTGWAHGEHERSGYLFDCVHFRRRSMAVFAVKQTNFNHCKSEELCSGKNGCQRFKYPEIYPRAHVYADNYG